MSALPIVLAVAVAFVLCCASTMMRQSIRLWRKIRCNE